MPQAWRCKDETASTRAKNHELEVYPSLRLEWRERIVAMVAISMIEQMDDNQGDRGGDNQENGETTSHQ